MELWGQLLTSIAGSAVGGLLAASVAFFVFRAERSRRTQEREDASRDAGLERRSEDVRVAYSDLAAMYAAISEDLPTSRCWTLAQQFRFTVTSLGGALPDDDWKYLGWWMTDVHEHYLAVAEIEDRRPFDTQGAAIAVNRREEARQLTHVAMHKLTMWNAGRAPSVDLVLDAGEWWTKYPDLLWVE